MRLGIMLVVALLLAGDPHAQQPDIQIPVEPESPTSMGRCETLSQVLHDAETAARAAWSSCKDGERRSGAPLEQYTIDGCPPGQGWSLYPACRAHHAAYCALARRHYAATAHCWEAVQRAQAPNTVEGAWIQLTWSQTLPRASFRCTIQWACYPAEDMIIPGDRKLEVTPPRNTSGQCIVGNGPAEECAACGAREPEEACVIRIVEE